MSCCWDFVNGQHIPHTFNLDISFSWQVFPAAGYAEDVRDNGGKVAVFNLEPTDGDDLADFVFLGPCEELLPKALGLAK